MMRRILSLLLAESFLFTTLGSELAWAADISSMHLRGRSVANDGAAREEIIHSLRKITDALETVQQVPLETLFGNETELRRKISGQTFTPIEGGAQIETVYLSREFAVYVPRTKGALFLSDAARSQINGNFFLRQLYRLTTQINFSLARSLKQKIKLVIQQAREDFVVSDPTGPALLHSYRLAEGLGPLVDPFLILRDVSLTTKNGKAIYLPIVIVRERTDTFLIDELKRLVRAGKFEEAKERIEETFRLDEALWEKGIVNLDIYFLRNTRLRNGKVVLRDLGNLIRDREHTLSLLARLHSGAFNWRDHPIETGARRISRWVSPPLGAYYRRRAYEVYSVENFNRHWPATEKVLVGVVLGIPLLFGIGELLRNGVAAYALLREQHQWQTDVATGGLTGGLSDWIGQQLAYRAKGVPILKRQMGLATALGALYGWTFGLFYNWIAPFPFPERVGLAFFVGSFKGFFYTLLTAWTKNRWLSTPFREHYSPFRQMVKFATTATIEAPIRIVKHLLVQAVIPSVYWNGVTLSGGIFSAFLSGWTLNRLEPILRPVSGFWGRFLSPIQRSPGKRPMSSRGEEDGTARDGAGKQDLLGMLFVTIEAWRQMAPHRAGDLKLHAWADSVDIKSPRGVDFDRLQHALSWLIENAIEFSDPGTAIDIFLIRQGQEGIIKIIDRGIGIPKEWIPRVLEGGRVLDGFAQRPERDIPDFGEFDPFAPGGLHEAKGVIEEEYQGKLFLESEGEEKGTTVTIRIPLRKEHSARDGGHMDVLRLQKLRAIEEHLHTPGKGTYWFHRSPIRDARRIIESYPHHARPETLTALESVLYYQKPLYLGTYWDIAMIMAKVALSRPDLAPQTIAILEKALRQKGLLWGAHYAAANAIKTIDRGKSDLVQNDTRALALRDAGQPFKERKVKPFSQKSPPQRMKLKRKPVQSISKTPSPVQRIAPSPPEHPAPIQKIIPPLVEKMTPPQPPPAQEPPRPLLSRLVAKAKGTDLPKWPPAGSVLISPTNVPSLGSPIDHETFGRGKVSEVVGTGEAQTITIIFDQKSQQLTFRLKDMFTSLAIPDPKGSGARDGSARDGGEEGWPGYLGPHPTEEELIRASMIYQQGQTTHSFPLMKILRTQAEHFGGFTLVRIRPKLLRRLLDPGRTAPRSKYAYISTEYQQGTRFAPAVIAGLTTAGKLLFIDGKTRAYHAANNSLPLYAYIGNSVLTEVQNALAGLPIPSEKRPKGVSFRRQEGEKFWVGKDLVIQVSRLNAQGVSFQIEREGRVILDFIIPVKASWRSLSNKVRAVGQNGKEYPFRIWIDEIVYGEAFLSIAAPAPVRIEREEVRLRRLEEERQAREKEGQTPRDGGAARDGGEEDWMEQIRLSRDLHRALLDTIKTLEYFASLHDVTLHYVTSDENLLVSAEAVKGNVYYYLDELIRNAIKYTPAGGAVNVSLTKQEGKAILIISDTGIGIPQEDIDHGNIWKEGFRAQNAEDFEGGSGTGLFEVKGWIDYQCEGCSIHVESKLGQGTTFTLTFPLYEPVAKKTSPDDGGAARDGGEKNDEDVEREVLEIWRQARLSRFIGLPKSTKQQLLALGPSAIPTLLKFFEEADTSHRVDLSDIFGEMGDPRASPVLVAGLKNTNESPRVRGFFSENLARIGDTVAISGLIEVYLKEPDRGVRASVASAIGRIGYRAASQLLEAIKEQYRTRLPSQEVLTDPSDTLFYFVHLSQTNALEEDPLLRLLIIKAVSLKLSLPQKSQYLLSPGAKLLLEMGLAASIAERLISGELTREDLEDREQMKLFEEAFERDLRLVVKAEVAKAYFPTIGGKLYVRGLAEEEERNLEMFSALFGIPYQTAGFLNVPHYVLPPSHSSEVLAKLLIYISKLALPEKTFEARYDLQVSFQGRQPDPVKLVALARFLQSPWPYDLDDFKESQVGGIPPVVYDGNIVPPRTDLLTERLLGKSAFLEHETEMAEPYLMESLDSLQRLMKALDQRTKTWKKFQKGLQALTKVNQKDAWSFYEELRKASTKPPHARTSLENRLAKLYETLKDKDPKVATNELREALTRAAKVIQEAMNLWWIQEDPSAHYGFKVNHEVVDQLRTLQELKWHQLPSEIFTLSAVGLFFRDKIDRLVVSVLASERKTARDGGRGTQERTALSLVNEILMPLRELFAEMHRTLDEIPQTGPIMIENQDLKIKLQTLSHQIREEVERLLQLPEMNEELDYTEGAKFHSPPPLAVLTQLKERVEDFEDRVDQLTSVTEINQQRLLEVRGSLAALSIYQMDFLQHDLLVAELVKYIRARFQGKQKLGPRDLTNLALHFGTFNDEILLRPRFDALYAAGYKPNFNMPLWVLWKRQGDQERSDIGVARAAFASGSDAKKDASETRDGGEQKGNVPTLMAEQMERIPQLHQVLQMILTEHEDFLTTVSAYPDLFNRRARGYTILVSDVRNMLGLSPQRHFQKDATFLRAQYGDFLGGKLLALLNVVHVLGEDQGRKGDALNMKRRIDAGVILGILRSLLNTEIRLLEQRLRTAHDGGEHSVMTYEEIKATLDQALGVPLVASPKPVPGLIRFDPNDHALQIDPLLLRHSIPRILFEKILLPKVQVERSVANRLQGDTRLGKRPKAWTAQIMAFQPITASIVALSDEERAILRDWIGERFVETPRADLLNLRRLLSLSEQIANEEVQGDLVRDALEQARTPQEPFSEPDEVKDGGSRLHRYQTSPLKDLSLPNAGPLFPVERGVEVGSGV